MPAPSCDQRRDHRCRAPGLGCALAVFSALLSGCVSQRELCTDARYDKGYTILLTGVTGRFPWDDRIARGLVDGGLPTAIEIHDWTRGPLLLPVNMVDVWKKRRETQEIAAKIVDYQKRYPGRPVHLVGLSGGGAMVVKTLEALPPDVRVDSAVLLAPAVSTVYDLRQAQAHTERGIHNFYSPLDLFVGGALVLTCGTIDGSHLTSAAVAKFKPPEALTDAEEAQYAKALTQHPYSPTMLADGHPGGHFGWTSPPFVRDELAPILMIEHTPPPAVASQFAGAVSPTGMSPLPEPTNRVIPAVAELPLPTMTR